VVTPDRVLERRGNRARFASPTEALTRRGDVRITCAGQAALSGLALEVLVAVDRTVADWARALGATEHRYPSLIDVAVLERAGQVESFPQHLTLVVPAAPGVISSGTPSPVIPNGAPQARSRGIVDLPVEGPLAREGGDSSTAEPDGSFARNDNPLARDDRDSSSAHSVGTRAPSAASLGMTPGASGAITALAPAVCYHAYPEWEGKTLGSEPTLLTAVGRCYRYEGGNHIPLERLWDFTMREIIVLGTREQVEAQRQALVRQVGELVARLQLDAVIEPASDPFFTSGDEGKRLMQQAGALKHELLLTVDAGGRAIAAASFNHHHDYFGTRFDIALADGNPAHSGCIAFGLERWVLALLAQHGVDAEQWPDAARAWLAAARHHRESDGARA